MGKISYDDKLRMQQALRDCVNKDLVQIHWVWSRLIQHNFVIVGDNWIKFFSLALV